MSKRFAKVKINTENCITYGDSIVIRTIFKQVWVPAKSWFWADQEHDIALVDEWCFIRHDLNPCQIVSGYLGTVTQ